ncbi:hypothetical protein SCA6_004415 [Theobroma cacao]
MKSYSALVWPERRRAKRPEAVLQSYLGENLGSVMRESQCLDTVLNLRRHFKGRQRRIRVKMLSSLAIKSADDDDKRRLQSKTAADDSQARWRLDILVVGFVFL